MTAATAYARRSAVIRRALGNAAAAAYDDIEDYSDTSQLDAFLDRMVPMSEAAQRALANTLSGYLHLATGDDYAGLDTDEVTGDAVRDEGMRTTWSIPSYGLWADLGEGKPFSEALATARQAVGVTAQTDLALAQRQTMTTLATQLPSITSYRRVPTIGSACKFCTTIATRPYYVEDLMPVHANCGCGVAPIMGAVDPGAELLERFGYTAEAA